MKFQKAPGLVQCYLISSGRFQTQLKPIQPVSILKKLALKFLIALNKYQGKIENVQNSKTLYCSLL